MAELNDFQLDVIDRLARIETKHDEKSGAIVGRLDNIDERLTGHDNTLAQQQQRLDKATGVAVTIGSIFSIVGVALIEWIRHVLGMRHP